MSYFNNQQKIYLTKISRKVAPSKLPRKIIFVLKKPLKWQSLINVVEMTIVDEKIDMGN
jgi:hypothetical protein